MIALKIIFVTIYDLRVENVQCKILCIVLISKHKNFLDSVLKFISLMTVYFQLIILLLVVVNYRLFVIIIGVVLLDSLKIILLYIINIIFFPLEGSPRFVDFLCWLRRFVANTFRKVQRWFNKR